MDFFPRKVQKCFFYMHASVGDGCHTVPYGKMTSPERDKPRSLRKDGFAAGTGQALRKSN
jgi:hypothetical protein